MQWQYGVALFFFLFIGAGNGFAQKKPVISAGIETAFNKTNLDWCFSFKNGYYVYKGSNIGDKNFLVKTDLRGNEQATLQVLKKSNKYRGNNTKLYNLFMLNGKVFGLYTCKDFNENKQYVLVQKIDSSTLTFTDSFSVITRMPLSATLMGARVSENSRRLMVHAHYRLWYKEKSAYESTSNVTVIDDEFQILYSKNITIPEAPPSVKYVFRNWNVDDSGNVVLVAYSDSFDTNIPPHVFYFSKNGDAAAEAVPDLSRGRYLYSTGVAFVKGEAVIAGLYTDGYGGSSGTWVYHPAKSKKEIVFHSFTPEFIAEPGNESYLEWLRKKQEQGKMPGIPDLRLKHIKVSESGAVYLFSEQHIDRSYTFYTLNRDAQTWDDLINKRTVTVPLNKLANIVVSKINTAGKNEWNTWILKSQDEADIGDFCSFACTVINDKAFILFNDHPDNFTRGADFKYNIKEPKFKGKIICALVILDSDGSQTRNRLSDEAFLSEQPLIFKYFAQSCGAGIHAVATDYKNKYRLITINFE